MKRSQLSWIVVIGVVAVLVIVYVWYPGTTSPTPSVSPTVSMTPLADNLIVLNQPTPGSRIASPLVVSGKARGTWFFEASFPVTLKNASGTIIAQAPAQAEGDWMTTEFVPFRVTLTFPAQPSGSRGTLILQKDNPSGLPEHDDSRQITVFFK
jgi:hypothetical protein